jgi:hypothetical protein
MLEMGTQGQLCDPVHLDWIQMGARYSISILFGPGEEAGDAVLEIPA